MSIYGFDQYREYILNLVKSKPNGGRGELLKIAKQAKIHTTTLSQILRGDRELSLEQAVSCAEYFGLTEPETRYFLLLVQYNRAGSKLLKDFLKKQVEELRQQRTELVNVVNRDRVLTDHEKAVFYSDWFYSAIRILASVPGFQTSESIANHLHLSRAVVSEALQFLLSAGLCVEENGKLAPGPKYTHLESTSRYVSRHHANWRIQALQRHSVLTSEELAYTSPMSVSEKGIHEIREILVETVKKVNSIREKSDCEKTYCLNLDWFKF